MKANQSSDQEQKAYEWLVNETKPEINQYQWTVTIVSAIVFVAILIAIISWWSSPSQTHSTSLILGGQCYALYGGLLLALQAFSSSSTLALMSMTYYDGNSRLFASLMKARFAARVGVWFILGGFLIQGVAMLVFGT